MDKVKKLDKEIEKLLKLNLNKMDLIPKIISLSLDFNMPVAIVETDDGLIARFYPEGKPIEYMLIRS